MPHATQHADVAVDSASAELDTALRGGPFHVALRAAIAARGLPLQRVQHHLSRYGVKVGVTSLSYWQQGARRPQRPESLRAVRALEEILHLPDESLIRLLAEPDGGDAGATAGQSAGRSYRSLLEASGILEQLLGELECPVDGGCTSSATMNGSASGRAVNCWDASRSTSCARTATASTASWPSITATPAAHRNG